MSFSVLSKVVIVSVVVRPVVERNGSGVELRALDYENPGSNPVLRC